MSIILITAIFAASLAFVLGVTLGFFRDFFAVPEDPITANIRAVLPGANCGACGYPGCEIFAAEVAKGNVQASACTAISLSAMKKIAAITGVDGGEVVQTVVALACLGSSIHTPLKGSYTGIPTCWGAKIAGGTKLCAWGCLGFGDCVRVCKFDALGTNVYDLPRVNYSKCTGCGLCVSECPQKLFKKIARNQKGALVLCSNVNPIKKMVTDACKISCFKCGQCVKNCPEQCINMETLLPVVDYTKCTSCGNCVIKCPTKVIKIIERDMLNAPST